MKGDKAIECCKAVSYTHLSATSPTHINAMDMNREYGDGANPVILKSEFIMSLCEQLIGGTNLGAKQKSIIDRCTCLLYTSGYGSVNASACTCILSAL